MPERQECTRLGCVHPLSNDAMGIRARKVRGIAYDSTETQRKPRTCQRRAKIQVNTESQLPMMTSSNGNIFRDTGHLCGEFPRSPVNSPHKGQWRGALMFSLICAWINDWVNNREAGDLGRHRTHYDVIVMQGRHIISEDNKATAIRSLEDHS